MMIYLWLTLSGCIDEELYNERRDELVEEEEEEEQRNADTASEATDTGWSPPTGE